MKTEKGKKMGEDVKHTPTPWTVRRSRHPIDGQYDYAISGTGSAVLAEAFGRAADDYGTILPAEANANFIVRAANAHEALVEALEKASWALAQAKDDLAEFEAGKRTKRSVSTSSGITSALSLCDAALSPASPEPDSNTGRGE